MEAFSADIEAEAKELWKRMVFNVCIGCTDDHLRNHGFLLRDDTWLLSPAYDVNPSADSNHHSLCISFDDNTKDIRLALDVAPLFRITPEYAVAYAEKTREKIAGNWQRLAEKYGIPRGERERMRYAFSEAEKTEIRFPAPAERQRKKSARAIQGPGA